MSLSKEPHQTKQNRCYCGGSVKHFKNRFSTLTVYTEDGPFTCKHLEFRCNSCSKGFYFGYSTEVEVDDHAKDAAVSKDAPVFKDAADSNDAAVSKDASDAKDVADSKEDTDAKNVAVEYEERKFSKLYDEDCLEQEVRLVEFSLFYKYLILFSDSSDN